MFPSAEPLAQAVEDALRHPGAIDVLRRKHILRAASNGSSDPAQKNAPRKREAFSMKPD